jgi:hypothetical protein
MRNRGCKSRIAAGQERTGKYLMAAPQANIIPAAMPSGSGSNEPVLVNRDGRWKVWAREPTHADWGEQYPATSLADQHCSRRAEDIGLRLSVAPGSSTEGTQPAVNLSIEP